MLRRHREIALVTAGAALLFAPSPAAELLGGALLGYEGVQIMEGTTSDYREDMRGRGTPAPDVAKWAGVIVIVALLILAVQIGGLRAFVQH